MLTINWPREAKADRSPSFSHQNSLARIIQICEAIERLQRKHHSTEDRA